MKPEQAEQSKDNSQTYMECDGRQGDGKVGHINAQFVPHYQQQQKRQHTQHCECAGHHTGRSLVWAAEDVLDFWPNFVGIILRLGGAGGLREGEREVS